MWISLALAAALHSPPDVSGMAQQTVAVAMAAHLIYAKSQAKTIKITDLWGYLMSNPETAFYLLSALANVISDQVPAWSGATLEVNE